MVSDSNTAGVQGGTVRDEQVPPAPDGGLVGDGHVSAPGSNGEAPPVGGLDAHDVEDDARLDDELAFAGTEPQVTDGALGAEVDGTDDLADVAPVARAAVAEDDADEDDEDEEDDDEDDVDDVEGGAADGAGQGDRGRGRRGVSLRRLEEEGEVAADYLEELLDIIDLDGDIDIDVENGRASVAVVAEAPVQRELRTLVGARGEVLEALQELSRLAVQARTGERSRLMLDIAGFRAARRRSLEDLAARAVTEVRRTGQLVRLDPMSAFERKVVHDVVADAGLRSESEGEDPNRRVVVHPVAG